MNSPSQPDQDALSPSLMQRVDQVCDQFEAAWRNGPRPRIEDYLANTQGPDRLAVLRELILLEIDYRRMRGETCRPQDYHARFPELDPAWLAQAVAAPNRAPPTRPGGKQPPTRVPRPPPARHRRPPTAICSSAFWRSKWTSSAGTP
jgi:serine/threonine-protein kinase